jgi:2-polyprenyl-6-methoxyphenol hydroxylase-like FAD-dependent oxidoreductase
MSPPASKSAATTSPSSDSDRPGATAANLAGRLGLRTLVVERDPDVFPRQRAIAMDDQALRVIRDIGLYDEVTARMHMGVTARFIGVDGPASLSEPAAERARDIQEVGDTRH